MLFDFGDKELPGCPKRKISTLSAVNFFLLFVCGQIGVYWKKHGSPWHDKNWFIECLSAELSYVCKESYVIEVYFLAINPWYQNQME